MNFLSSEIDAGFETENLFGGLINEEEIQRRLEFLADRILDATKKALSEKERLD